MCSTGTVSCLECNAPVGPTRRNDKSFCSAACKDRFNNRRKARGAELYDLFMNIRFNRAAASEAGAWALMCRMASNWKQGDDDAGRKSFQPLGRVNERLLVHKAVKSVSKTKR